MTAEERSAVAPGSLPAGRLVRSRVVDSPGTVLRDALDRELTGYATLEPQGSLLAASEARGVIVFEAGVPALAYHPEAGGGPGALPALAGPGPVKVALHAVPAGALPPLDAPGVSVAPEAPAERLAEDPALVARTRRAAPEGRVERSVSAVEAFLADEAAVEAVRNEAREEATRRAEEWGLDGVLADDAASTETENGADGTR